MIFINKNRETQKLAQEDLGAVSGGYKIFATSDTGIVVTGHKIGNVRGPEVGKTFKRRQVSVQPSLCGDKLADTAHVMIKTGGSLN